MGYSIHGSRNAKFPIEGGVVTIHTFAATPHHEAQTMPSKEGGTSWRLFTEGYSSAIGPGAGLVLTNNKGKKLTCPVRFQFALTDDAAECEALMVGLNMAKKLGIT